MKKHLRRITAFGLTVASVFTMLSATISASAAEVDTDTVAAVSDIETVAANVETALVGASWNSNGSRGSTGQGIYWNANIDYYYDDSSGNAYNVKYSKGQGFRVHYFAKSGKTLDFSDNSQRAFCIEPDKSVELTGSGKYTTSNDLSGIAQWNKLTDKQKKALNYVLACGYGNYSSSKQYWYATQLLVYEVVAYRRSMVTFEPIDRNGKAAPQYGKGFLNPSTYLAAESGAETTVSAIQTAYNNMIGWVKKCLNAPSYANLSASSAPTYTMERNSDGTYSITLHDDNLVIDMGHGSTNASQNTVSSDFKVDNSSVSVTLNKSSNTVTFKSSKALDGKVKVTITNSFVRGLQSFKSENLSIIVSTDWSGYQAFARGCTFSNPVSYFYLNTPKPQGVMEIYKKSANKELTNNNSCYSLEGAKFQIFTDKDCKVPAKNSSNNNMYIITDESGVGYYGGSTRNVTASLIESYYVKEIEAPKGFALNKEVFRFTKSSEVSENGYPIYSFTCTDAPQLALDLTKVSADTTVTDGNGCYSLAGAVYQVFTDSNCTNALTVSGSTVTITTDENGYGTYNNLTLITAQTLYAKEIKASPGYELDATMYQFYNSGRTTTKNVNGTDVTYPIYSLGRSSSNLTVPEIPGLDPLSVLLQKYDATTGKGTNTEKLAGAEYTVRYYANNYSSLSDVEGVQPTRTWVFKTDSDGAILFKASYLIKDKSDELFYSINDYPEIPFGFITVQETLAPYGYQLNEEIYFTTIDKETTDESLSWHTTNVNLDKGILQFPETENTGGLSIKKEATDGIVQDVWFAVYKGTTTSGTLIGNFKTDASGLITNTTLSGLTAGRYLVSELGFSNDNGKTFYYPKRYGTKPYNQSVTVKTGETATVTFKNVAKVGQLIINKTADDNKTAGVFFEVTGTNGKSYRVSTLSNGQAVLSNLQVYDDNDNVIEYTIHELGLPDSTSDTGYSIPDYYLKPEDQTVDLINGITVVSGYNRKTVSFYNKYKTLRISIAKYSDDSADDYPEVYFRITSDAGYNDIVSVSVSKDSSLGNALCDQAGYKTISNLPALDSNGRYITYTVTELGYSDGKGGYVLPEYFFDAYLTKTVTANPDAEVDTDNQLSWFGDIVIAESSEKRFTAHPSYINRHITGSLTLNKTSFNNAISDFYFELKADDGSYSSIDKTDGNGQIKWNHLNLYNYTTGKKLTYTVTELGYSDGNGGYYIPEWYSVPNTVTVNFTEDITSSIDYSDYDNWLKYIANMNGFDYDTVFGKVGFENEVTKGSLKIVKNSEDGDTQNYWFNVKDNLGNDYGNFSTGNSDSVIVSNLPVYNASNEKIKYTVTELGKCYNEEELKDGVEGIFEIPIRYKTPSSKTVTINSDRITDALVVVTITNTLKRGSVSLYKQDENGKGVAGSEWTLFKADGTAVLLRQSTTGLYSASSTGKAINMTTNTNGRLIISQLEIGDYYLVETKPIDEHMPYGQKIEFSVAADSDTALYSTLTAKNYKPLLPNTGACGSVPVYIIGSAFLMAAFLTTIVYLKNRRKYITKGK